MRPSTLVHAGAGTLALLLVTAFWLTTIISELTGDATVILIAKTVIAFALPLLVAALITAGVSGFRLGGKSTARRIVAKRRRMPVIALNGMLILVPSALFLLWKAEAGAFDTAFVAVQGLELAAGALNIVLLGLNFRDGRAMTAGRRRVAARATQ